MELNQSIDKNSNTPLHMQVENIISDMLKLEPFSNGEKLPNEIELAKELGVSRNTVRKAMDSLLHKNLIIRKKNRGTFKNQNSFPIKTTLNNWYSFNEDMKRQNKDFKLFFYDVSYKKCKDEVQKKLQCQKEASIIKLTRVKGYLEPDLYVESYFHPSLELNIKEFNGGKIRQLYTFLEDKLGIKILFSHEEIMAKMPSNEDKKYLSLEKDNVPLLVRKMLIHDENGNKIAYSIGYYLADKFVFDLHISR